jgi:hypothetical protein
MYINAVAESVMLYLHGLYNTIFGFKHKLYIASGLVPPPPTPKILGAHLYALIYHSVAVISPPYEQKRQIC